MLLIDAALNASYRKNMVSVVKQLSFIPFGLIEYRCKILLILVNVFPIKNLFVPSFDKKKKTENR